jgi:Na+/proline symporter/signal transduction histidine kinase
MTYSLSQLLTYIIAYLSLLFGVGYLAERGVLPPRLLNHPVVYVLSLGVLMGGFAITAIMELALLYGYSFLSYYAGFTLMFLLSPLLLYPLMRICRIYQLSSLADLLSFRFRSRTVGAVVTVVMLTALLPLLTLQIQAVSESIHILAGDAETLLPGIDRHDGLALLFCATIALFTVLFGTRHVSVQERNEGLVAAIAFESLAKLLAMLVLGFAAIYLVFGGFSGLGTWLESNPGILEILDSPLRQDSSRALLLIFFAGAVVMPHIFHMTFTEHSRDGALRQASWGFPLYMLLISLPVLPIAWATIELGSGLPGQFATISLGAELGSIALVLCAFFAGLSAASAVIIVSTLALANMCLNYLVLPTQLRRSGPTFYSTADIYGQLLWQRRLLVLAIITAGYLFYRFAGSHVSLIDLGLAAFIGTLQFLPGIVAAVYWPRANRQGLLGGVLAGYLTWTVTLLLPMVSSYEPQLLLTFSGFWYETPDTPWSTVAFASLAVNLLVFVTVSLATPISQEEARSAEICSMDDLNRPIRQSLALSTAGEFKTSLAKALGEAAANAEVDRALSQLQLTSNEDRPYALRRLRRRIEANLSGLVGPAVAYEVLQQCIPWQLDNPEGSEDISLIERRLENTHTRFTGLAADLDALRRYHRETLQRLPIGVLSLGPDGEVLMWNQSMETTTGVQADAIVGSYLSSLPANWSKTLIDFVNSGKTAEHRLQLGGDGADTNSRWISLHRGAVESSSRVSEDQVILVEDLTDYQMLERELVNSERLASIGRLAAGIAHEIGNPVTGIACLAQNLEFEEDLLEVQAAATDILKQTERVTRIVESLVNFSHTGKAANEPTRLAPTNLADCVDEAVHLLQLDHTARVVEYQNACNREQLVLADSQKLLQVFINLLGNARDACDDDGLVVVECIAEASRAVITVTDNGCGISRDLQEQVFEPFFTTKEPGEGTGLGLSLVYSILEDMNGRIQVVSPAPGSERGSRFILQLANAQYRDEYQAPTAAP